VEGQQADSTQTNSGQLQSFLVNTWQQTDPAEGHVARCHRLSQRQRLREALSSQEKSEDKAVLTSTWIGAIVFVAIVSAVGIYLANKEKRP